MSATDLYREHRTRMVRLASLLVDDPNTAEDVVQEAFAGLHRHWGELRDEAAALGYLRTAVVNGSRSVLRRRRTARDYVPPHQREVLVLRYYGGLSEAEIAEATGITRGTVKSTASRALDAVGRVMNPRAGL